MTRDTVLEAGLPMDELLEMSCWEITVLDKIPLRKVLTQRKTLMLKLMGDRR
jgi:hypothetical protein